MRVNIYSAREFPHERAYQHTKRTWIYSQVCARKHICERAGVSLYVCMQPYMWTRIVSNTKVPSHTEGNAGIHTNYHSSMHRRRRHGPRKTIVCAMNQNVNGRWCNGQPRLNRYANTLSLFVSYATGCMYVCAVGAFVCEIYVLVAVTKVHVLYQTAVTEAHGVRVSMRSRRYM